MALKLVVTKFVYIKLVINLWRSAPPQKTDWQRRPAYAEGGYRLTGSQKHSNSRHTIAKYAVPTCVLIGLNGYNSIDAKC